MKKVSTFLIVLTICMISTNYALGESLTAAVTGTVNSITTEGGFTADDQDASESYGKYSIPSLLMTIGNYDFIESPVTPNRSIFEVWKTDLTYIVSTTDGMASFDDTLLGHDDGDIMLFDLSNYSSNGPNDDLPTSFPDISFFEDRKQFEVSFSDGSAGFTIAGEIDSIVAVPEPATIALLGLGSLIFVGKTRKSKRIKKITTN